MGVMSFLRERMGKILAIVIGLALFAFVVGEVLRSGSSFFKDDRNLLGEVSGEKVAYDEFLSAWSKTLTSLNNSLVRRLLRRSLLTIYRKTPGTPM